MLLKPVVGGKYKNVTVTHTPACALFQQQLDLERDEIIVVHPTPITEFPELHVPLSLSPAELKRLDQVEVTVGGSSTAAYRMGDLYDAWFSAYFGYAVVLVYIGDQGRDVLAHRPSEHRLWRQPQQKGGWLSSISSSIPGAWSGGGDADEKGAEQLTFNDCAPYLLTSKASLRDVSGRLPEGEEMDMRRFRPNIVVDADPQQEEVEELKAWDEDYWAEVTVTQKETGKEHHLAMTANCGRCISINVDYNTGRPAEGEPGTVLKKLMPDRRVDEGNKYTPIFGRYAFLAPGEGQSQEGGGGDEGVEVAVGDEIHVTKRLDYRDTWAWPKAF
jgi:uncharacterized protein YcbX